MTMDTPTMNRRSVLRSTVLVAGAAVALPSLVSLAGCSAPASISEQMSLISAVSDRIIPVTDTPGAVAAGVPEYIAAVFDKHFTKEQQGEFLSGLEVINASGFSSETPERQDEILNQFASASDGDAGRAIFQQIHDMTLFGYYTSETATQELSYEEIPGRYVACVPLSEVGRAWLDRGV